MNPDTTYFFSSGGYSVHMPVVLAFVAMERAGNHPVTLQSISQHFGISRHVVSKYVVPFFPEAFTLVKRVGPIPEKNHAPIKAPRPAPASPTGRGRPAKKGPGPTATTTTTTKAKAPPAVPPIRPDVSLVDSTPLRPPPTEVTQDTQNFWESVLGDTFYTMGMGMTPAALPRN